MLTKHSQYCLTDIRVFSLGHVLLHDFLLYLLMKKLLIFDYDQTLAPRISPPSEEMLHEVARVLENNYLAVMSGGRTLKQIQNWFVKRTPVKDSQHRNSIFLCPAYGNKIYQWEDGGLGLKYEAEKMDEYTKEYILDALRGIQWTEFGISEITDEQIKKPEIYFSFDCLPIGTSKKVKETWDPEKIKRQPARKELEKVFKKDFEVYATGRSTIDILPKGKNKADNTQRLAEMLDIPLANVVFTGDEFEVYGNDYPLLTIKEIQVNPVKNPEETLEILKNL